MSKTWAVPVGYRTPATGYPRATQGSAAIRTVRYEPGLYEMYGVRGAKHYRLRAPLDVTTLVIDGRTWMVDDPAHWESVQEMAGRLRPGHVLVAGLGLGLIVHAMAARADIDQITVVERNPDVVALVAPLVPDRRLTVVQADFWPYLRSVPRGAYSTMFIDLWVGEGETLWHQAIAPARDALEALHPYPETLSLWFGVQPRVDLLRRVHEAVAERWKTLSPEHQAWLEGTTSRDPLDTQPADKGK